jgi:hypothetical protein
LLIGFGFPTGFGLVGRFPDPSDLALQPLIEAGLAADRPEYEVADYRPGRRRVRPPRPPTSPISSPRNGETTPGNLQANIRQQD